MKKEFLSLFALLFFQGIIQASEADVQLLRSADSGNLEKVRQALGNNANPNIRNSREQSALELALQRPIVLEFIPGTPDYVKAVDTAVRIANALLDAGTVPDSAEFVLSVLLNQYWLTLRMRPMITNINRSDNYGRTPLSAATLAKNRKLVEYLVSQGAEFDPQVPAETTSEKPIE